MSWTDQYKNDFIIKTGDGKIYTPLWKDPKKEITFNITEFEFIEVDGALVIRKNRQARRFILTLFFQGDDNIDKVKDFEKSANDTRPWRITHPFYGNILCQPARINIDDSMLNVSKLTISIVETVPEDKPRTTLDPIDEIKIKSALANDTLLLPATNLELSTTDTTNINNKNSEIYNSNKKTGLSTPDFNAYTDIFNKANAAVILITEAPLQAMRITQTLMNYPALLVSSIKSRLNILKDQFDRLINGVSNLTSPDSKRAFEISFSSTMAAMALATVEGVTIDQGKAKDPLTDDITRLQIVDYISTLKTNLDTFNDTLAALQTEDGGDIDSYIPDAESQQAINDLILFTINNLFALIQSARQERVIRTDEDTNIILLTHRFYGLASEDNVDDFININNFSIDELLQVKRGREIIYYV